MSGPGEPNGTTRVSPLAPGPPLCPNCGATRRVSDPARMEVHCESCGLVFEGSELVAAPPSIGTEGSSDGSGRGIGPFTPPSNHRRALGSTLSGHRDGQGRPLDWHRRYEFQHLRRVMQRQTARSSDGSLERSQARSEIELAGQRLDLPSVVVQEAERIFREGKLRGLFRGRNLPSSVGATLYAACRRYSIPRTLGEVAKGAAAERSEVGRVFKLLRRGADLKIPSVGTRAFLIRYAEELALSHQVRSTVEEMLEEVSTSPELSGISSHGLVAALIYLASARTGEPRSRAQVARVSAVTEVTLRSTTRLLERIIRGGTPSG
ncbi:MAG TPA: TFIIB-type zinc ribbon-containing protein [Thermoplasmata archaeon]|nr:TFIIB-type zinc ribbon-containing protein [Thermoplasmata archaeon]HEV2428761.1 TFIIB-type zinc ribbon-containing protein [Thermoplasmata archaeon]